MKERFNPADDIEISERYDREDDVYYVTMRTAEPSLTVEVDDTLLVEFGMFTSMPTGFRILNYAKNKREADAFKISFKQACKAFGLRKLKTSKTRRQKMERRIDKFFDTIAN